MGRCNACCLRALQALLQLLHVLTKSLQRAHSVRSAVRTGFDDYQVTQRKFALVLARCFRALQHSDFLTQFAQLVLEPLVLLLKPRFVLELALEQRGALNSLVVAPFHVDERSRDHAGSAAAAFDAPLRILKRVIV